MAFNVPVPDDHDDLRSAVGALCADFPSEYWRKVDEAGAYPEDFVNSLTSAGWLSALIPEEYGGSGLEVTEASIILEEVNRAGGNSGACHGQNRYVVNSQKVWTARLQHSDLMILLARTTPVDQVRKKSDGLSVLLVDVKQALAGGMSVRPIRNMVNHETNEVFFDDLEVPAENLVGEEGKGFRYILEGLNAERTLIAAECIGDGHWFTDKAVAYAKERSVFGRSIGMNQGIQVPIAQAYADIEAASLMRFKAAWQHGRGKVCGGEANMAKLLAADASWKAANACLHTRGGFGFAAEYDVERKFRETRLYQVAPISSNLILAYLDEHVLGMPRSY